MPPDWHPLLATHEHDPGRWRLIDSLGTPYADIELRRTADGPRYRVAFRGTLIGWAGSLRLACERAHAAFLAAHGPRGAAMADHGGTPWHRDGARRP